jgi:bifunctional ADP-heptose synthase (sugar kinase/adenylyltransferase)
MLNEAGAARELNRLDIKNRTPTPMKVEDLILQKLDRAWPQVDALIVLDQVSEIDCGVVTKRIRNRLTELGTSEPGKFVLADSREQIVLFRNVCVKPNEREICETMEECRFDPEREAEDKASELARITGRHVFLTRGERGIFLATPGIRHEANVEGTGGSSIPTFPVSGPIDIVGAGDSCSAGIVSAMVSGTTHQQAAAFGNLIASITVQQIGVTGTASPEQVRSRWREVQSSNSG